MRGNLALAHSLEVRLGADGRLDAVVVNASTGRVLIEYDPVLETTGVAGDAAAAIVDVLESDPTALRFLEAKGPAKRVRAFPVAVEAEPRRRFDWKGSWWLLAAAPLGALAFVSANPLMMFGTTMAITGSVTVFLRSLRARNGNGATDVAERSPIRHLEPELREHRGPLIAAAVLTVCSVVGAMVRYILLGGAVDAVVPGAKKGELSFASLRENAGQIVANGGLLLGMTVIEGLFEFFGGRIWRRVSVAIEHRLRLRTYAMIQRAELGYLQSANAAELRMLVAQDVTAVDSLLSVAWDLLQNVATMAFVGVWLLVVAPEVAWICMLGIPVTLLAITFQQNRLLPRHRLQRKEAARLQSSIVTAPEGLATIKSFTAEKRQLSEVSERSIAWRDRATETQRIASMSAPIVELSAMTGIAATVVAGGLMSSNLTVGRYSTLIMMSKQMLAPLASIGKSMETFQRAWVTLQRLFRTLESMPLEDRGTVPIDPRRLRGNVNIRNIHFSYDGGQEVLHDVSATIRPGTTTAIVGPTGSGKSTLLRLLVKFRRPSAGTIRLGNQSIESAKTEDIRRAFAFVSQEVFLFSTTIRDNIAFARPDASQLEIERAARIAMAHEFIERLPDGYDTMVGEHGLNLSGGERQRISIARALVADAPILVLDEATSQLDNQTEAQFYEALRTELPKKTKIIVAHRLAAARTADRIYVLEDGRVCEEGTHDELLAHGGLYATLWRLQVQDGLVAMETDEEESS